jgi:hypothetical protein
MGIDDAIARAHEAEAQRLNGQREQRALDAKKNQIVDELYRDFVKRVVQAGVKPLPVTAPRVRRTLFGRKSVDVDTGQKAWVVYWTTTSEQLTANPWLAVMEDGSRILVHIEARKDSSVLRRIDRPHQEFYTHPRQPWVDAEEFEQGELKRISDETSEILAQALVRLGAV